MKVDPHSQSLLEHLRDGIVVTDAAGCITWGNSAFTEMCGYSLDEVRGRKPGSFLQGAKSDVKVIREVHDALKKPASIRFELLNYHKDGHSCPLCLLTPASCPLGAGARVHWLEQRTSWPEVVERTRQRETVR